MIYITNYELGMLQTNCYIIEDKATGKLAIVDPGSADKGFMADLEQIKDRVELILLTHGHYDHIGGVAKVQQVTGADIYIYELEKDFPTQIKYNLAYEFYAQVEPFTPSKLLKDNETFMLGETKFTVLHTPGHTIGSCCYIADDSMFSGDTLFHGSMGRTDFITGSPADMVNSLQRLKNLDGNYNVYPGHGPSSTLDWERKYNPFMQGDTAARGKSDDFEA